MDDAYVISDHILAGDREFDHDSLYRFKSIGLGSTLPLSLEDAMAHRAVSVQGCVYFSRDLIDLVHQIDPLGDWEYHQEMRWHGGYAESLRSCDDTRHKGRRELPESAFRSSVDGICLACQMRDQPAKKPGPKEKHGKLLKAFRPRKFAAA